MTCQCKTYSIRNQDVTINLTVFNNFKKPLCVKCCYSGYRIIFKVLSITFSFKAEYNFELLKILKIKYYENFRFKRHP